MKMIIESILFYGMEYAQKKKNIRYKNEGEKTAFQTTRNSLVFFLQTKNTIRSVYQKTEQLNMKHICFMSKKKANSCAAKHTILSNKLNERRKIPTHRRYVVQSPS